MKIKKLHEDAILPKYGSEGASAFDVFAMKLVIHVQILRHHFKSFGTPSTVKAHGKLTNLSSSILFKG